MWFSLLARVRVPGPLGPPSQGGDLFSLIFHGLLWCGLQLGVMAGPFFFVFMLVSAITDEESTAGGVAIVAAIAAAVAWFAFGMAWEPKWTQFLWMLAIWGVCFAGMILVGLVQSRIERQ